VLSVRRDTPECVQFGGYDTLELSLEDSHRAAVWRNTRSVIRRPAHTSPDGHRSRATYVKTMSRVGPNPKGYNSQVPVTSGHEQSQGAQMKKRSNRLGMFLVRRSSFWANSVSRHLSELVDARGHPSPETRGGRVGPAPD